MNRFFFIAGIISIVFVISSANFAKAYNSVQQDISIHFPAVNVVSKSTSGTNSTDINPSDGSLNRNLVANFDIETNNPDGVIAQFQLKVDTTSGMQDAMSGKGSNKNNGRCVLANTAKKPSPASVQDALSKNASVKNNPNVITYNIKFKTIKGFKNPKFSSTGNTTASGLVLNKSGRITVKATVNNRASYTSKTYHTVNDNAGTYQAILYCTVYSP